MDVNQSMRQAWFIRRLPSSRSKAKISVTGAVLASYLSDMPGSAHWNGTQADPGGPHGNRVFGNSSTACITQKHWMYESSGLYESIIQLQYIMLKEGNGNWVLSTINQTHAIKALRNVCNSVPTIVKKDINHNVCMQATGRCMDGPVMIPPQFSAFSAVLPGRRENRQ